MNSRLIRFSIGIVSLLLLVSCGNKQQGGEAPLEKFPTMVVDHQNVHLETVFPVTIKGTEDVEIRPRIDGLIEAMYVDEGSVVRAGQPLFKINSPSAIQSLATAQAAVQSATASLNTAKVNVDRIRPLAAEGIVSEVQLQTSENAYKSALEALNQANASLANAKAIDEWTRVLSPINGVVGAINLRTGSLVSPSTAITTVANTDKVYAYFSINEKLLMDWMNTLEGKTQKEKIANLPAITLIMADGSEYTEKGKIETISGVVNVTTGSANLRVEFPNKEGILKSGSSGKIIIPQEVENVFVIPQAATFAIQNKTLLFKVQGDSVVQKTISVAPMPDGKSFAVTEGLEKGDKIVTDGLIKLSNGKKILTD